MDSFVFLVFFTLVSLDKVSPEEVIITTILTDDIGYLPNLQEGFIVDLIDQVADIVNFEYRLKLVADGRYGKPQLDGTWNGMIGELVRGEADMAVAPMAITSLANRVVDFSHAFLTTGYKMLMKKSTSSYINSWEDLESNGDVNVVVLNASAELNALQVSTHRTYERLWVRVKDAAVWTHLEGVHKIIEADEDNPYVLILPMDFAEAYAKTITDVDLVVVGEQWMEFGYGIAFPLGSPYKDRVDLAVLELMESGELHKLRKKWFGEDFMKCSTGVPLSNINFILILLSFLLAYYVS